MQSGRVMVSVPGSGSYLLGRVNHDCAEHLSVSRTEGVSAEKSVQKPPARLLQLAVYPQRLPALVAGHEIVAMHRRAVRVAEIPPADFDPLRPGNQCQLASVIWKLVLLRQRLRSGQDQQRALQRWCQPDRGARAAALGGKRRDPDRMLGPVVVDCLQLEYALGAEPRV